MPTETEASAFIARPESYAAMRERPRFQDVLDQGTHRLKDVLSPYSFAVLAPCGLKGCRQKHRDGFLVETVDGLETNMGHVCAVRFFGDDFKIARARHLRERERADLVDRARQVQRDATKMELRVADLNKSTRGIKWVGKVKDALRTVIGEDLIQSLSSFGRRGDLDVVEVRQRTEAEIANILQMQPRQRREQVEYESQKVGRLASTLWLTFEFHVRLREGLLLPLQAIKEADLSEVKTPKLRELLKGVSDWEATLSEASEALASAEPFLAAENLHLLCQWIPDNKASRRRALEQWIESKPYRELLTS